MLHHQDTLEEATLLNSEMQNLQKFKILDFFETRDLGFNTLLNYFPYRNQEDLDTNCLGFLYGPEAYTEGLYSSFYTPTLDDDQSELIIGLYAQLAPQLLEFLHEYGGKTAGVKWSNYNRLEKSLVEEAHDFFAIAADFVSADYVKYRPYDFIDEQCNYSVELIFNAMANVLLETPVGQVIRRWLHARLQWLNEYPFKPLPKDPEAELARLEKLIDEFDPSTSKALRYEQACVTWQEVLKADVRPVLEGNFSSKQQIYTHLFSRLPWLGNYLSQLFYVVVNAAGIKHPEHQRFLGKLADEFAKFCIWAPASLWCRAFQVELAVDPEIKKFLESSTPAYSKNSDLATQAPAPAQVNPNSLQRKGKHNKHQSKNHERKNQAKPAYMQAFARTAAKDAASDAFAAQASVQLEQGNTNTHTKANPATKAKKPKGQLGFSLEQALQAATLFNRQPPLPKRAYPNSLLTAGLKAESLLCAGASNHIDVPTDPELYQAPLTEEHPFISHLCFSFPLLESSHKQVQEWTAELKDPARQLEEAYNFCLSLDQTADESTSQSSHSAGQTTSDSTNQPGQPEQEPQSQNQAGSDKPLSKSAQAFRHAVLMAAIDHPVWLHVNTNAQVSGVGRGQKSWLMRPGSDFANTSLYTGIIGSLNPALMANFAGSLRDQISFTQDQILTHILDQAHDNIFVHANRQAKRELYEWYSDEPAERVTNRQIRALQKDYEELSDHIKGIFRDARGKLVIKWPNDIYLLPADYVNDNSSSDKHKSGNNHYHTNLQKVSGLLAQKDKYLMCSFGLNVLPSAIKEGLHTNATFNYRVLSSLIPLFILARKRTGKTFDRLLNEIAQLRNDLVAQEPEYALLPEWIKQNFGLTGQREGKQGDKGAKVKEAKVDKEEKVGTETKVGKETNQGKNKAKGNENLTYAQAVKLAHKLDNEHLADYLKGHRYFEAACAYFNNLGLSPDILQKHKVKAELQTELARLNKVARQDKLSTEFNDKSGLKVEGFALPKFNPALKDSPLISLMFKIFEICGCQTKVESFPYATLLPALYPAPFRFLSVHQVFKELYLLTMRCTEALSTTRSELDLFLPDLVAEANANANKTASTQAKASAQAQDDAADASNFSLESLFQAWKNSLKERFPAFISPDYQKHALYQVGAKVRTSDDQGKPLVGTVVGYNQYGWLELEPTTATEPTVEHAAKAEQDKVKPAAQPAQKQATYQLTSPRSIRGINAKDYTVFSFDYKTILEANQVDAKLDD